MNHVQSMFDAHPNRAKAQNLGDLGTFLTVLMDCATSCAICADACGAESNVQTLVRCMRLNMDCAEVCSATACLLTRAADPDWRVIRAQLQACIAACSACAEECERHAKMHAHCRICAETCRACERACQQALGKVPAMAMA